MQDDLELEKAVISFVNAKIPLNWNRWDTIERKEFWKSILFRPSEGDIFLVKRERICAAEIWCELLGRGLSTMTRKDAKKINKILEKIPAFEKSSNPVKVSGYGVQRCYIRTKE